MSVIFAMMNKIFISALAALAFASCNKGGIEFAGKIDNAAGKSIYLYQMNLNGNAIVDSAKISDDGTFVMNVPATNEPTFFMANIADGKKQLTFLTDSLTESVKVTANYKAINWQKSVKFLNSEESDQLNDLVTRVDDIQRAFVDLALNKQGLNQEQLDEGRQAIMKKVEEHKAYVHQFVFDHPRSFVSYFALYQVVADMPVFDIMDKDDQILYNTVATSLLIKYPQNARVKQLADYVLQARAYAKQKQKTDELLQSADEINSPDLNLADKDGNMHRLSELRGKVVILQFWSAQDQDSRTSNKQLVKLYKKYASKGLAIYQVSFDTSKILWEDAINTDGLSWVNVVDNGTALSTYNVSAIPSNYIIGRDGSLVGKNLFGTRLDNKMAELLK